MQFTQTFAAAAQLLVCSPPLLKRVDKLLTSLRTTRCSFQHFKHSIKLLNNTQGLVTLVLMIFPCKTQNVTQHTAFAHIQMAHLLHRK